MGTIIEEFGRERIASNAGGPGKNQPRDKRDQRITVTEYGSSSQVTLQTTGMQYLSEGGEAI